ncbi:MAG: hypothetical protein IGS39_26275 [Calothrix sp. C42_A2020_038]|nr:hypothetical protein [Calothrix sp. C42_A2020_038]
MLKLTYTETDFHLECITQPIEDWIQARVILSLRAGQSLCVEPSTASFLLPVDLPGVEMLKAQTRCCDQEVITVCVCDTEYLEVTLHGSWISYSRDEATGIFVTTLSDRIEFFLYKLWQEAQACQEVKS